MTNAQFIRLANSPLLFRFFMFWKLPAAWFMGIGLKFFDGKRCVVQLPYGWRSQNPFKSTYFAAQCGAAEMSTGLLALAVLQEKPPVSMLVTNIEAAFLKKVSKTLLFTCEQGAEFQEVIRHAVESGDATVFRATSIGRLPDGAEAARVWVTWSFKLKKGGVSQVIKH